MVTYLRMKLGKKFLEFQKMYYNFEKQRKPTVRPATGSSNRSVCKDHVALRVVGLAVLVCWFRLVGRLVETWTVRTRREISRTLKAIVEVREMSCSCEVCIAPLMFWSTGDINLWPLGLASSRSDN